MTPVVFVTTIFHEGGEQQKAPEVIVVFKAPNNTKRVFCLSFYTSVSLQRLWCVYLSFREVLFSVFCSIKSQQNTDNVFSYRNISVVLLPNIFSYLEVYSLPFLYHISPRNVIFGTYCP